MPPGNTEDALLQGHNVLAVDHQALKVKNAGTVDQIFLPGDGGEVLRAQQSDYECQIDEFVLQFPVEVVEFLLLPPQVVVDCIDFVFDLIDVQVPMDILIFYFLPVLPQQIPVRPIVLQFEFGVNGSDEIVDFIQLPDCLVASFKALAVMIVIVYLCVIEMNVLQLPQLIDHLPSNLPGHDAFAVCYLLAIEIRHPLLNTYANIITLPSQNP